MIEKELAFYKLQWKESETFVDEWMPFVKTENFFLQTLQKAHG